MDQDRAAQVWDEAYKAYDDDWPNKSLGAIKTIAAYGQEQLDRKSVV